MYEVYREKWKILEYKDGCVFKTESLGCDWYPEELVKANKSRETNIEYGYTNVDFITIRKAKV